MLLTTDEYEIEGFLHIKPGGYQSRVSDLLNAKGLQFVPVTHVTYRSLRHPEEPARHGDTLIVRLDSIKMVVPDNGQDRQIPDLDTRQLPEDRYQLVMNDR